MKRLFDIYYSYMKIVIAMQLQYRASLLIWAFSSLVWVLIPLVVWVTVAKSQGGQVGSYSSGDFAAYFIALLIVEQTTFTWVIWEMGERIRSGQLSPKLLRPIHPIHEDVAWNISYKAITFALILPSALLIGWAFHAEFHPHVWHIVVFFPSLISAFLMRFVMEWTIGLVGFWVTRTSAINQIYSTLFLFLSGQMTPLSLLPRPLEMLANILPFKWAVAFPTELVLGRLTPTQVLLGFAIQASWLLVSLIAFRFIWRLGISRYSAVGA